MHTLQFTKTSAPTISWVRAFVDWMMTAARSTTSAPASTVDDRRVRADIESSRKGDGAAYARIIERYQNVIARRMTRFTHDPLTIEELTHDVFVEAYFSLGSYRADAPLEHWLQRIATRVGYKYWKRTEKVKAISFQEKLHDKADGDNTRTDDGTAEQVAVVLGRMSPRDRMVLTLLYLESRSVAEAADLAGWSQTMVKVQAYRARKKFHALFTASQGAV